MYWPCRTWLKNTDHLLSSAIIWNAAASQVAPVPTALTRGNPEVLGILKRLSTGTIGGRVLDSAGKGVEGIWVEADNTAGKRQLVLSDDTGGYRLGNLPHGEYKVHVEPRWPFLQPTIVPEEIRTDGSKEVQYTRIYYPGTADEASAGVVVVTAGIETTGIDIHTLVFLGLVPLFAQDSETIGTVEPNLVEFKIPLEQPPSAT
jgi:hypothetical protein